MGNTDFGALCDRQRSSANTVDGLRADVTYWKNVAELWQAAAATEKARAERAEADLLAVRRQAWAPVAG